jgi:hypothetical protein
MEIRKDIKRSEMRGLEAFVCHFEASVTAEVADECDVGDGGSHNGWVLQRIIVIGPFLPRYVPWRFDRLSTHGISF